MEHFNPLALTEEQAKNNPNKYWDGFLGQKVKLLCEVLKKIGNVSDVSVTKALDEAIAEVPKNKADFISKEEILIRALELYAKENDGFAEEKLKRAYIENLAPFLAHKLHACEFDTVDQELQKEIEAIQKADVLAPSDLSELREKFGIHFSDIKMKEYEEEMGGKK